MTQPPPSKLIASSVVRGSQQGESHGGVFLVDLDRLAACGVRECEEQGEAWLCLLVRYPVLRGLRLPEDEIINIKCKPQDRAVAGQNAINFQEAM